VQDVSASMAFGTGLRLKSDVAEGVAATVARLAVRRGGRVAVVTAGAPEAATLPPRSGRGAFAAVRRLVGAGVAPDEPEPELGLPAALDRASRLARTRALVTVVSDFRDEGWQAPLRALAQRHTVTAVDRGPARDRAAGRRPPRTARPRDRPQRRGRHGLLAGSRRVCRGRGRAPRRGRRRAPARAGPPRHPGHGRRLAARARPGAPMTFDAPVYLLALIAIPAVAAIAALARKRRRRYAVRFPATAVFARVAGDQPRLRRVLPPALLAAAAAASAIALAKPEATLAVPVEKASVVLVTDESGLMAASDVDPSRLAAAQSAAKSFLGKVPDSLLVGFVGFSSQTNTVVEPTLEHDRVKAALDGLRADGGTATGDALTAALDRLEARRGKDGRAPRRR
jgi:uncharacterized protein (DUF58 family)